ncbi:MAG: 16S rRNA (cytosine(1402)-N(4))-methyltransferase RsmH [Candidatus Gottesmanbacteria bacterium]|nr:16S rRNA (cytosine(1402)-N(4))-methyltransferase RsmH [Candidatus Gottesmanbacteria bacterium]
MGNDIQYHTPVMVEEVMNGLLVRPGGTYIDATIGGGGHGLEILKRGGRLLGIDQDPEAFKAATERLEDSKTERQEDEKFGNWKVVQGNFRSIEKIAKENGFDHADGILFDLGVSSHQIDTPDRGFSYRFDQAPLDLRMNPMEGIPAWEVIKKLSEEELYEIFATYGEEKLARTIAGLVVRARRITPVKTTGDLMQVIAQAVTSPMEKTGTYARIFQALRIFVNDELGALRDGIGQAKAVLGSRGRLIVLSYHSLEDRIVKREFIRLGFRSVNKRPITPSETELQVNSRSRSAKLRIGETL